MMRRRQSFTVGLIVIRRTATILLTLSQFILGETLSSDRHRNAWQLHHSGNRATQVGKPNQSRKKSEPSQIQILEARALLNELGYWIDSKAVGFDASLRHALIAFQKTDGRLRTGVLTIEEMEAMRTAQRPVPLESGYPHIEVDLNRQILLVVDSCGAVRILSVSSGSGEFFTENGWTRRAVTPTGRFKVTRKVKGWRKSPLGLLYYPNYIHGGVAIHGNPSVPVEPKSHGCIRIPMFAAKEFYEMAAIGMVVLVYDGSRIVPPMT